MGRRGAGNGLSLFSEKEQYYEKTQRAAGDGVPHYSGRHGQHRHRRICRRLFQRRSLGRHRHRRDAGGRPAAPADPHLQEPDGQALRREPDADEPLRRRNGPDHHRGGRSGGDHRGGQSRQVHPRVERGRDQGAARGGGLHPCQAAGESGSRRHHRRGHGVRRPCGGNDHHGAGAAGRRHGGRPRHRRWRHC